MQHPKGGDNMTNMNSIVRHRWLITAAIAGAMFLALAPATLAQGTATDPLGIRAATGGGALRLGDRPLIQTIVGIINVALGLLGIIAVVIILIAGFKWMTAGGNEEQVTEAKARITQGVIGLAVILSAYAIASFAVGQLASNTGVPGAPTP
ncbi:MAG: hypothetical protein WC822_05850 [Candidatus Paceibacterota bacterium]|jgi:hypothetical protein